jgi:hypothetical protein
MVCGQIGSSAFAPAAKGISIFNGLITFLAVIFCILGCVSNANSEMAIYKLPWALYTVSIPETPGYFAAFGIRGFVNYYMDPTLNIPVFNLDQNICPGAANPLVQLYADCGKGSCNPPDFLGIPNPYYTMCDKCSTAAGGIVGTLVISLLCAMVAFVAFFLRCCRDSLLWKDVSTIAAIAAFCFGVIAYAVASPCKGSIEALAAAAITAPATYTTAFGQGAKIVAGSWSMLLIVSILALLVPAPATEAAGNTGLANKK